jgi:hypothetical protein
MHFMSYSLSASMLGLSLTLGQCTSLVHIFALIATTSEDALGMSGHAGALAGRIVDQFPQPPAPGRPPFRSFPRGISLLGAFMAVLLGG